jgi:hypothetical protein
VLDKFYRNLADFINQNNPDKGWHIIFAKARVDRPNFTFLGQAGCTQWWTLNMDLRNDQAGYEAGKDPAVGTYTGKFILRAEHDLSDFANDPAKYFMSELGDTFASGMAAAGYSVLKNEVTTEQAGTAELTRVINGNATVTVKGKQSPLGTQKMNGYDYTISMDGSGEPNVAFSGMEILLDFSGDIQGETKQDMLTNYMVLADSQNVILECTEATVTTTMPKIGYSRTDKTTADGPIIPWNSTGIWKPWESTKTLK